MPLPPLPFDPPPVPAIGGEIHRTFEIALPSAVDEPVIRFTLAHAEVWVSRRTLEGLVNEKPATWNTEGERLASIAGSRAKKLLERAADPRGAVETDGLYLIATLLETGGAVVRVNGVGCPSKLLRVTYFGSSPGPLAGMGHITLAVADPSAALFTVGWFVR